MGLVIDSSVFITLERRGHPITRLTEMLADEDIAISTVTASELLVGVHRADSLNRRTRREAHVEHILWSFELLPFDLEAARVHAQVGATLGASGRRINAHDLLIAATALAHGHGVFTDNPRDFGRVPGLVVRQPDW